MKRVAVLGAGNAGCAAAAHLTQIGLEVRLYNRWENEIEAIKAQGGIQIEGVLGNDFYHIPIITSDIQQAVEGADLVWVATPAVAHEFLARQLAPLLPKGAHIFLNPGNTGGALAFAHALHENGGPKDVVVAETNTNIYICRITKPGTVKIWNLGGLLFSAFPGRQRDTIFSELSTYFSKLVPVTSVLDTGFANVNAIMHPAVVLMNAGWIERTEGAFKFYADGATPGIGAVVDQFERERLATMAALGITPKPFVEIFYLYGATTKEAVESGSAYVAMHESVANREIQAPPSLRHRFLTEDVPFGIVPISHLASLAGVQVPITSALITLASAVSGVDWMSSGVTLEKMGMKGITKFNLQEFLREGKVS
jgi:opine dehydrogenase